MATKKRYSDINKAIKEAEARREAYYKQVGRVMLEEYPELGDMTVTEMRRAARFLRDNLPEKYPSACPFRATARALRGGSRASAPAPRKGCPARPVPSQKLSPSRRRQPVGNGTPLGVRRGRRKPPPRKLTEWYKLRISQFVPTESMLALCPFVKNRAERSVSNRQLEAAVPSISKGGVPHGGNV